MTIHYLVRHAKPAATWGEATDPGLDAEGVLQARAAAAQLAQASKPLKVFTSPLQRCRETAMPLAAHWRTTAELLPAVAEIPSPPVSLDARKQWLAAGMSGNWTQLQQSATTLAQGAPDYSLWRRQLLEALHALTESSVIFTHYIAINVVIGAARQSDDVIVYRPGHASITAIDVSGGAITIRSLGREAEVNSAVMLGR